MARPQLNLRLAPELLERLERTAAATGTTVAALCRGWILNGLDGGLAASSEPSSTVSSDGLAERLAAVEARLAALEAGARVGAGEAPPSPEPAPLPPVPPPPAEPHEGTVFSAAELGDITGTNPKGWINWAQGKEAGAVRVHPQAGSWELLGKRPDPRGGPARVVFRRVAPPKARA